MERDLHGLEGVEADGRWFCSSAHRAAFDGGRREADIRARRRAVVSAVTILVGVIAIVLLIRAFSPARPGPTAESQAALTELSREVARAAYPYPVKIGPRALRVADAIVDAEYVRRTCMSARDLFGDWTTTGETCAAIVEDAFADDAFLVRGSRRVAPDCKSHAALQDVPGIDISAKECVVYEIVGRRAGTYLTERIAVFVAPEKGSWRVVLEETSRTGDSDTPPPDWARRVPHVSRAALSGRSAAARRPGRGGAASGRS